jgi:glucose-6-phosphate dehydrogenase assembly protein OpcA
VSFTPGIPVPIGGIEKELGKLWEESGDTKTRASLINLAIYNEKPGSLEANSVIVGGIAGEHAMRAILVEADPKASGSSAEAWINMHCYPRGSKGGSVCSEQISFRLGGEAATSLQSVVFSHLDSDLPLALWWQADFRSPVEGKLWRWVDRLLFDSRYWKNPAEQFDLISRIAALAEARTLLCDLNWARSLPIRQALAGIFDTPGTLPELHLVRKLELDYAPGYRTTALLLIGWLADRLGWTISKASANPEFLDAKGAKVTVELKETAGSSIGKLHLVSENASFDLTREQDSDLYVTTAQGTNIASTSRMVRAPREETREILLAELSRGGRHPLYSKAIKAVQPLWD